MDFKKIIKKWGAYALGVMAITGGMIASNSANVSASENNELYLVREFISDSNSSANITLTKVSSNVDSIDDINAVRISSQSVRFSGGTFNTYRNKYTFNVDISNIDNFDYQRDVIVKESSSGSAQTAVTSGTYDFVLYNSTGSIESFLERSDLYTIMNKVFHDCARQVITLTDESAILTDTNGTITSFSLASYNKDTSSMATLGSSGFSTLSSNNSFKNVDINFYIRTLDNILFGTMDGLGENVYTEKDVNDSYNSGYLNGHTDGYLAGSIPNPSYDGKYSYIIKDDNVKYVIDVDESNLIANGIAGSLGIYMGGSTSYNVYSGTLFIDIDGIESLEDITYDRFKRSSYNTNTSNYHNNSTINFYSSSNDDQELLKFINTMDFVELRVKLFEIIFENEFLPLNEGVLSETNTSIRVEDLYLNRFVNVSKDESNNYYSNTINQEGSFSLNASIHSGDESVTFNIVKRTSKDVYYGDYIEDGDAIVGIGQYETGFSDGYEAGLNAKGDSGNSEGGYTEEDLNAKYEEGFADGESSVDITVDNEDEYNRGYEDGVNDSASEYADRLEELDTTISNLNKELGNLQDKIEDYENSDDKYATGYEHGYNQGHSAGYAQGFDEALDVEIGEYGEQKYQEGFNAGNSAGYAQGYETGYNTAKDESDIVIGDKEEENSNLTEQVENLQNDIKNLNNQIDSLTGTISSLNGMLDVKYEEGFADGVESVDITSNDEEVYNQGFADGYEQYEIDHPPVMEDDELEGYQNGYIKGFEDGANSVDITSNDKEVYDQGFADGAESVDITSNDKAVFDKGYEEGFEDGVESVTQEDDETDDEISGDENVDTTPSDTEKLGFWQKVGNWFKNVGALFANAWGGIKGWFR